MNGRAKLGAALIFLGLLLLFGAFGLWQSNRGEALEAEEQSRAVMRQLAPAIADRAENPAHLQPAAAEGASSAADPTMDTVEVDGRLYVGFLTVPDLGLELPVMADWDYDLLKIAPCRYSGTLQGGDLVIAAHNYDRHFGRLRDLQLGAEILFTDVNGNSRRFRVAELEILQPGDVEAMTAGDYALSLFTCTYGGATRFTVRCLQDG